MAQSPDLLNNEEFEKVDHDPYQDENISSTSLPGEMAEEDRYQGDSGDLLGDEYTSTAGQLPAAYRQEADPLISFESSPPPAPIPETTVTEPTPPPTAKAEPEPVPVSGGAWLENVDPREDPQFDNQNIDAKEYESDSESDTSMSLDGSGESSDIESDSGSESSASETDETGLKEVKENITGATYMSEGAMAFVAEDNLRLNENTVSVIDKQTINSSDENKESCDANMGHSIAEADKVLNKNDISESVWEENTGCLEIKKENDQLPELIIIEEEDKKESLAKQTCSKTVDVSSPIPDDNICSPYFEDICSGNSGYIKALEKQSEETTCLQEEGRSLSDSGQNNSLLDASLSGVIAETDHIGKENKSECIEDTGAIGNIDADMMEANLRLGILKSDLRVSEELGSDHNSDRGSTNSEELHVHFKDEVVIMEFSDEEKEEPCKPDQTDDGKEHNPLDYLYPQDMGEFIEKDSFESMENKENHNLEISNNEDSTSTPELNFSLYKIGKVEDKSNGEGAAFSELDQKQVQYTSPVCLEQKDAELAGPDSISENNTKNLEKLKFLSFGETECIDDRKMGDIRIEEAGLIDTEKSTGDSSDSSKSDSDGNSSDEDENISDSSDEGNISGEWNVSPLCDIENANTDNALIADIPKEIEDTSEVIASGNICLLNYAPIDEGVQLREYERQDTFEIHESEPAISVTGEDEKISIETVPVNESVPSYMENDSKEALTPQKMKTELDFQEVSHEVVAPVFVEEQLKEVERHMLARLISDTETAEVVKERSDELLMNDGVLISNIDGDKAANDEAKYAEKEKQVSHDQNSVLDKDKQHMTEEASEITVLPNERTDDLLEKNDSGSTESKKLTEKLDQIGEEEKVLEICMTQVTTADMNESHEEISEKTNEQTIIEDKFEVKPCVDTQRGNIESGEQIRTHKENSAENIEEKEILLKEECSEEPLPDTLVERQKEISSPMSSEIMPPATTALEKKESSSFIEILMQVIELIYWRDVKKTGIVFGSMMFVLISLACFSLLSVIAYLSLAILTVTFSFRVYKSVMQAVQKTNEGHPFKKLFEMNIELKDECVQEAAQNIAKHINCCHTELRRLFLVQDYVDSIKFGMLLWLLTYIGSWFSGMTLIILVVVSIFTLPRVYETYKVQIDTYINMARAQLNKILAQISAKIPFPKKKPKTQ